MDVNLGICRVILRQRAIRFARQRFAGQQMVVNRLLKSRASFTDKKTSGNRFQALFLYDR